MAVVDPRRRAQDGGGAASPMLRVAVEQQAPAMPPDYALSERQRELLARRIAQGAPKGTRANRPPELELTWPQELASVDQALGAPMWTDSLSWTPPATASGYYCVRGVVRDLANQQVVVINAFGMR